MAYDKIIDSAVLDAGLTQIANAIREKSGTSDSLEFPNDMVQAVESIETGGGDDLKKFIERTETIRTLPSNLTKIGQYAFYGYTRLTLTSLPTSITSIESYAFENCNNLALTSLPINITSIGGRAFYSCKKLTTITFEGTPTSIVSTAFSGCTNLKIINVPWAEGEVQNAPWGATSATINYNYTEE